MDPSINLIHLPKNDLEKWASESRCKQIFEQCFSRGKLPSWLSHGHEVPQYIKKFQNQTENTSTTKS